MTNSEKRVWRRRMDISQGVLNDLTSAFNAWLVADKAAPKGDNAVIQYLFEVLNGFSPDEQQKERIKWLDSVERTQKRQLADLDETNAKSRKTREDDLSNIVKLRKKLEGKPETD